MASGEFPLDYKSKLTSTHYGVILICFLMNMCDGMNVMVISYTANSITSSWNINPSGFGIVFSVGLLGMALGAMLLAPKADVIGRKPMILLCALWMGLGSFVTAYALSLEQLIFLRFFTGIGIGSMLACTSTLASEYAPQRTKNFWVSFVMSGYPVGAVLSGLVATQLIAHQGWPSMYIFSGIVTLLTIPLGFFFLKESIDFLLKKQPTQALQKINSILLSMKLKSISTLPSIDQNQAKTNVTMLFNADLKSATILTWTAFLMCFAALYFLTSWIPKLAFITGLSNSLSIYAGILFNLGAFVGILTQGYLSAKFGLRKVICFFLLATALLMMLFGFFTGTALTLIFFGLIGFGIQGGFIGLYSVAARIYSTEVRSTGIGWAIGFGRLGAIIGPFVGGLLISSGWSVDLNFIAFALPLVVAGVVTLFIKSSELS
ncbi:MFS transporter [Cognataquiflexum rubidum]|uniref:MFS transporter n=1 Tax=Cognataquiflexum rubidum TaxID=2922273 RepID=UPI001F13BD24|nr:MFS transporter [Cognataquiflexum rubidum]MCH6236378.1 MFS transporter [Cognataquiflexum rubidum]